MSHMAQHGKLIVIEGTDGSGKATQSKLLLERMQKEGIDAVLIDFPQYGKYSAGFVEKLLQGEYGTIHDVDPYQASLFYAMDRFDASFQIRKWLDEGKVVLCDRYTSANMMHQSRLPDMEMIKTYLGWLKTIEWGILKIPVPDLVLFLDVPPKLSMSMTISRSEQDKNRKMDILEKDERYIADSYERAKKIAELEQWRVIACVENEKIMDKNAIADTIWERVSEYLKIDN